MAELYLHPHVASTIIDNSIFYATAQGLTNLFACGFAEKGPDNVLTAVDNFNDFLNKFGDVYSSLYGQTNLNCKNWLQSGGCLSYMRVLPDDATFGHAILDFQVRRFQVKAYFLNGKEIKRQLNAETGAPELVAPDGKIYKTEDEIKALGATEEIVDKVMVRPSTRNVPGGATSQTAVEQYVRQLTGLRSEDGYVHYPIGFFIPNGRGGGYYNLLRALFTLNTSLENTYSFRVYNLQFFKENLEEGTMGSTIDDSTYMVSFDPEAVDLSEETMYLPDVLQRYAKEIGYVANTEAWEELCEVLNPNVDPGVLDILFLQEKENMGEFTSYHTRNALSTGMTYTVSDIPVGDDVTSMIVADPAVLAPDNTVIINGIYTAEIQEVNLTTGKITFKEGIDIIGEPVEDQSPVSLVPDPEFRQTRIDTPLDGSTVNELSCLQVEDANGVRVLVKGPAVLYLDGEKFAEIDITKVNEEEKTISLATTLTLPNLPEGQEFPAALAEEEVGEPDPMAMFSRDAMVLANGHLFIVRQEANRETTGSTSQDFDNYVPFGGGDVGSLMKNGRRNTQVCNNLLIKAYTGQISEKVLDKEYWLFDVVLDANYDRVVKDAIHRLCAIMRKDCVAMLDLGFTGSPEQAVDYRRRLGYSSFYTSLWSQDALVYDESEGRWQKVTATYFLAKKIPQVDVQYGLHWTFVGPRRGVLSGFDKLSWAPNPQKQELLYKAQVNYIRETPKRTMLYGNLTSQTYMSALSDVNHVRTLLRIQREVEQLFEDYPFEFLDDETLRAMNYAVNEYMSRWVKNRALQKYTTSVTASDYDKKCKIARVTIEYYFTAVLERIFISHVVQG